MPPGVTVTLSLPVNDTGSGLLQGLETQRLISSISHPAQPKTAHWTRRNLLRRVEHLVRSQSCLMVLYVSVTSRADAQVYVGGERRWLSFGDLRARLYRPNGPPVFLFVVVQEPESRAYLQELIEDAPERLLTVWSSSERAREVIAIGCQVANWWGLRCALKEAPTAEYLASVICVLVDAINRFLGCPVIQYSNNMRYAEPVWEGGQLLAASVDVESIWTGARAEQVSDTVKRMADAAARPRATSMPPDIARSSSQGLLWLCELPRTWLDFDWFPGTRLAEELFGPATRAGSQLQLPALEPLLPTREQAVGFLESFVTVISGTYRLGCEKASALSEPPAPAATVHLPSFGILRRPITQADWRQFTSSPLPQSGQDELPAVRISAAEAMAFAQVVTIAFRRHGLIGEDTSFALPTEQQWEAAARGTQGYLYPWGNDYVCGRCNCNLAVGGITPPGTYSPQGDSPVGCQDMAGNVREWTRSYGGVEGLDWSLHSGAAPTRALHTVLDSDRLIIRGGSYSYDPSCVATWVRNTQLAGRRDSQTGFRLVLEAVA